MTNKNYSTRFSTWQERVAEYSNEKDPGSGDRMLTQFAVENEEADINHEKAQKMAPKARADRIELLTETKSLLDRIRKAGRTEQDAFIRHLRASLKIIYRDKPYLIDAETSSVFARSRTLKECYAFAQSLNLALTPTMKQEAFEGCLRNILELAQNQQERNEQLEALSKELADEIASYT